MRLRRVFVSATIAAFMAGLWADANALPISQGSAEASNLSITAPPGTLVTLGNWVADAFVVVADTASGVAFDFDGGGTGASAASATAHASGAATAFGDDGALTAMGDTDLTGVSNGFAESDAIASLFTTLMLTGGSGTAEVAFSFDYILSLSGDAGPGGSYDLTGYVGLIVSDGATSYFLDRLDTLSGSGGPQSTFSAATLSDSFLLAYDVEYTLSWIADVQQSTTVIPEPATLVLCVLGGAVGAAARVRGRRMPAGRRQ